MCTIMTNAKHDQTKQTVNTISCLLVNDSNKHCHANNYEKKNNRNQNINAKMKTMTRDYSCVS